MREIEIEGSAIGGVNRYSQKLCRNRTELNGTKREIKRARTAHDAVEQRYSRRQSQAISRNV
jgi:hypothetical protein